MVQSDKVGITQPEVETPAVEVVCNSHSQNTSMFSRCPQYVQFCTIIANSFFVIVRIIFLAAETCFKSVYKYG